MALGVAKSLEVIADVQVLAVDVSNLLKSGGFSLLQLGKIVKLISDVQELVGDSQGALPELKDLDAAEIGQLTSASYVAIRNIIAAVVA